MLHRTPNVAVRLLLCIIVVTTMASCSESGGAARSGSSPEHLKQAARAYAEVWLRGSTDDFLAALRSCTEKSSRAFNEDELTSYVERLRSTAEEVLGRSLEEVEITGVKLRRVSGAHGEAEVQFDLPEQLAGNDNWIEYTLKNDRWVINECKAPIGGQSDSASCVLAADEPKGPTDVCS